jgi:hypothetical protein
MRYHHKFIIGAAAVFLALAARAEVKVTVGYNTSDEAKPGFKFKTVPSPTKDDAAAKAKFTVAAGEADPASGDVDKLNDGKLPDEEDQPAENFFFNAGTEGGRIQADLGSVIAIKQVNTYSWHPSTRAPQVYKLYASDGTAKDFSAMVKAGADPEKSGWKLIAKVDTRPKTGDGGGQYGVSIADTDGALGKYRYLLFDCARTEDTDDFGNTFYSEIDVITQK